MLSVEFAILVVGLGGGFVGWCGYKLATARRRLNAERRLQLGVGSFSEGEGATVVGTVRAIGAPLTAPLSGKPCVAYEARARAGLLNFSTEPEVVRARVIPFEIEANGDIVAVETDRAELVFDALPMVNDGEREIAFAKACGITAPINDVSCSEICVEIGRMVAVHGVVSMDLVVPTGYRQTAAKLKLGPHPEHALTIGEPP